MAMLGLAACAQVSALKTKLRGSDAATSTAPASRPGTRDMSFSAIVNELQLGRYNEGEHDLRRYLQRHPDDRPAMSLLRQLTIDPELALGHSSHPYVVQPGDSYSTLAARYLKESGSFLLLARYNGSSNPSLLRVGQTIRLPSSGAVALSVPVEQPSMTQDSTAATSSADTSVQGSSAPAPEAPSAKAERMQRESLALLDHGKKNQALARLGEALSIDPGLKPAGARAVMLRDQLLASYHEHAILLYRDQKLDQAITLWDRILSIQPDYEPAVIYRARALELKQRLKQL